MDGKYRKIIGILLIVAFFISVLLIGMGIYFCILGTPKVVFGKAIDQISYLFTNYVDNSKREALGNTFSLESEISFNLNSEYYANQSKVDLTYLEKANLLKNLTGSQTKILVKQDLQNKKAFFNLKSNIGKEKIIGVKYLVDNSTGYYLVEDILNTYVNNGNCKYFESLDTENSLETNFEYLYRFTLESLKSNLNREFFRKSREETVVFDRKQKVNLISLKIDERIIKEILKGTLSDLKKDERASKILTSFDEDFSKAKISENKSYLKKDQNYTINIYTSKVLNKFLKAEIIFLDGSKRQSLIYEGDSEAGNLYVIDNAKVNYIAACRFGSNKYELKIKNSSGKDCGELTVEFDTKSKDISFMLDNQNTKYDIVYSSKSIGEKSIREQKLKLKIVEEAMSKLDGDIIATTKVTDKVEIEEDVSKAILKATLTEQQKELFDNKVPSVKERMKR